jgi:hypothetical protein
VNTRGHTHHPEVPNAELRRRDIDNGVKRSRDVERVDTVAQER